MLTALQQRVADLFPQTGLRAVLGAQRTCNCVRV